MNNPALAFHTSIQQTNAGWGRYIGIGLTLALNGLLIWALANGLATKITTYVPAVLETKVIDTPQAQPKPVTPPPSPQIEKVIPAEQTPEPVIQIAPDTNAQTIQVQPQQQVPVQADASAAGVMNTHTAPPYPPVARRLGEQGTVILAITVAADGSVSAAQIATSSGVPELDQAALSWVKAHWRYKPAMQGGVAVPSSTQAAVKFDLKQAH
ncbi:MAG: energy transducer TonB [Proteobacteria bacterium]|nr:energy transducer TonB [Pseudomonadota bacterium]